MMQSSAAYDGMKVVGTVHHGWIVLRDLNVIARGFRSNAEAWSWIDRNSNEGRADYDRHYRIRNAFSE